MLQVQRWAEVRFQNTNKLGFIIKLSSCYTGLQKFATLTRENMYGMMHKR